MHQQCIKRASMVHQRRIKERQRCDNGALAVNLESRAQKNRNKLHIYLKTSMESSVTALSKNVSKYIWSSKDISRRGTPSVRAAAGKARRSCKRYKRTRANAMRTHRAEQANGRRAQSERHAQRPQSVEKNAAPKAPLFYNRKLLNIQNHRFLMF